MVRLLRIRSCWIQAGLDVIVNAFMLNLGNREIARRRPADNEVLCPLPRWLAATV
jgi:hypothetical protein